ncbi:hypothetical protein ACFSTC_05375 [Nonomuraea ferruginea]
MLRIYDTLTGQVEEIAPARGLRMYACAPPVHRRADLGDLRPALLSDLIRRVLERHRVRMVVCLGVDDVGCPVESARAYEEASARDAAALNLRSPELSPRAAEHAGEVVELVAALVERGHAYAADGGWVFFDSLRLSLVRRAVRGEGPERRGWIPPRRGAVPARRRGWIPPRRAGAAAPGRLGAVAARGRRGGLGLAVGGAECPARTSRARRCRRGGWATGSTSRPAAPS